MTAFTVAAQPERAPEVEFDPARVRTPQYGRWLDDFEPGEVFAHPRGYTFERSEMRAFASSFHQANPLHLNVEAARAHGFEDIPVSAQMVFNVVLSLGVQNDSEKAVANLGYYNARFLRPVYAGDTLRGYTRVHDLRDRGAEQPGIVHVHTIGVNQREEVVLRYERKIMIRRRPADCTRSATASTSAGDFPWPERPALQIPHAVPGAAVQALTGGQTYFEDFAAGDVLVHPCGRTVTDEHVAWTYRLGNTHPLHYDRLYSSSQSGPLSGEPVVYGGLVFAWLDGLASRDLSENALWELGFTEGYHTAPAITGDTVYALTRVLSCEPAPEPFDAHCGVLGVQLIGVKNETGAEALERHGSDLFIKEGAKKALGKSKIPSKVFEIERELLVKRRPG